MGNKISGPYLRLPEIFLSYAEALNELDRQQKEMLWEMMLMSISIKCADVSDFRACRLD